MTQRTYTPVSELTAQDFPPVLRIFFRMYDNKNFSIASVVCAIICFCVLCPRKVFCYFYDKNDPITKGMHHLLLQAAVIAQTSDGKSFSARIYKLLLEPILKRDRLAEAAELEYAELKRTRSQSKDKPQEPVTVKLCHHKFTRNKMIKRCHMVIRKYLEPLTMMLYSEELSTLIERRGSYGDLRDAAKMAYDGGELTTDTNCDASYNATVEVRWCSIYNTTPKVLYKYMDPTATESGNANRLIPLLLGDMLGEGAPGCHALNEADFQLIHDTQDRLMAETYTEDDQLQPEHVIPMEWLFKDEKLWCESQLDIIGKTCSHSHSAFYKRASNSAARIAALCYHLWGENPKKRSQCRRIYYFFADYILKNLLLLFGKQFEKEMVQIDFHPEEETDGPTLYDQMPKHFTRDQLKQKVEGGEYGTATRQFLYKWREKHLIYEVEKDVFEKLY